MTIIKDESLPVGSATAKQFGQSLKLEFPFDPEWTNLNHGSFGTAPNAVIAKKLEYSTAVEMRPDHWIRYVYPGLLNESRAAVAGVLNAPVDAVVLVQNATEGVNTVLRNMVWNDDGKDVILSFSTVYEACGKSAAYLEDYFDGKVVSQQVPLSYPVEDAEVLQRFRETVGQLEKDGKRPRICIFDVVSSRPGVRFPWEDMVAACKGLGIISLVDGAQGIGMVKLDLAAVDPDYFVSNCHKWLHVPRSCAVLYVPVRNQHLLPTTLATSHGYEAKRTKWTSPLPSGSDTHFVYNFGFVGTKDNAPYCCLKDSISYRRDVLGGEDKIVAYLQDLSKRGSKFVAQQLGTKVLDNDAQTLTNCGMANVALPIWREGKRPAGREGDGTVAEQDETTARFWGEKVLNDEKKTFMPLYWMGDQMWTRISAQVYLDMSDYEFAAKVLAEVVARIAKREYLSS